MFLCFTAVVVEEVAVERTVEAAVLAFPLPCLHLHRQPLDQVWGALLLMLALGCNDSHVFAEGIFTEHNGGETVPKHSHSQKITYEWWGTSKVLILYQKYLQNNHSWNNRCLKHLCLSMFWQDNRGTGDAKGEEHDVLKLLYIFKGHAYK